MTEHKRENTMYFPTHPIHKVTINDVETTLGKCKSWQEKYREIMLIGKTLARLPEEFLVDSVRVHGCESNVWLYCRVDENRLIIHVDSDSKIVKGLLVIVLGYFQEVQITALSEEGFSQYLERLALKRHLSPSRNNGIQAVAQQLLAIAAQNAQ